MAKFKIEYPDPETGERKTAYASFEDTASVTALEWAEDYAYSLSDKNLAYTIIQVDQ